MGRRGRRRERRERADGRSSVTGARGIVETALWQDALEAPEAIAATLERADGHAEVAALLAAKDTQRVVATGNGASWYVASAFWLASLTTAAPCNVVTVPAGLIAAGGFAWRDGDVLLAFSSSGELRDLVEAVACDRFRFPICLVTAAPESSLGRAADARALVTVRHQRAVTHTQAYLGAAAVAFDLLGRWSGDESLRAAARNAEAVLSVQLLDAPTWGESMAAGLAEIRAAMVCGANQAWFAALEAALLLKEVAGLRAEGMEIREGATTGMYPLAREDLVITLPFGSDRLAEETASICAATGATVCGAPWPAIADRRQAVFAHFAHPLSLAIRLALDRGRNPDHPGWTAAYEATARRQPRPSQRVRN
jgi:glucosamine 6-phosphate synthetase-like amidotransferase/phosphosugar isomerase protein